jgi:glutamine amidotransferase
LGKVRTRYPRPPSRPAGLWKLLRGLAGELNELGVFNFLLSDASYLYAHCSNHLCWLTRKAPFGKARLIDADMVVDFQKETTPKDIVTVIATRPLTNDEVWEQMARNEFRVFHEGTALG